MNPLPRLQAARGVRIHAHELEEPRAEDRININAIRRLVGNDRFYPNPRPKPSV